MKINEIKYERATFEDFKAAIDKAVTAVNSAKSTKEVIAARETLLIASKHFETEATVAHIRFTLNTKDEFYLKEMEHYDEVRPLAVNEYNKFIKAILASPFLSEVKNSVNPLIFQAYEMVLKAADERIIPDMQEENKLITEYSKFMSEMSFEFKGEKMPLSKLRKYMQDGDRNTRREAYNSLGKTMGENAATLDGIFDKLVKVRDKMAKTLGMKDFVELAYCRMNRISFDRKMVEEFRNNVLTDIVPVVSRLKKKLAAKLNIKDFKLYDNDTYFSGGEPEPIGKAEDIFRAGKEMYRDMSPETDAFMHLMLSWDAFDVESRDGKWGGGYMTAIPDYDMAFILANFCGTNADVDVITHEFGHAFAYYLESKVDHELKFGGMETAETHSMSMEFFAWKYIDKFFGERAGDYKYRHLFDSLSFIPYGVIVDYFQHIVYENPGLTPAERKAEWKKLEAKFRPYMDAEGIPYLEDGARWQFQMHIYEQPFYYIDYCIAQSTAIQFLKASLKDYKGALKRYFALASEGGGKLYGKLVEDAGLKTPFVKGALKEVAADSEKILEAVMPPA